MSHRPPQELTALLDNLGLSQEIDMRRLAGQVKRLARNLPVFDSVWTDALLQARQITRFQAAEIHAGRGHRLRVGPYVLEDVLSWPHYAAVYRARQRETAHHEAARPHAAGRETSHGSPGQMVRLVVVEAGARTNEVAGRLEKLAARAVDIAERGISPIMAGGVDDHAGPAETTHDAVRRRGLVAVPSATTSDNGRRRVWAASAWIGRAGGAGQASAAQWMVRNGRFPPEVVLEVARQMASALATLESAKIVHGDVSPHGVALTEDGGVILLDPGLRGIVRPTEGYAHAELPPEAYDCLAPERVAEGGPPTLAADLYACGCVWWHMLAGRPPLSGGDGLSKLQAVHTARIVDIRRFVADVPKELLAAMSACLAAEPEQRPPAVRRLIEVLGPSTADGRAAVLQSLRQSSGVAARWIRPMSNMRVPSRAPRMLVAATCVMAVMALVLGPFWRRDDRGQPAEQAAAVVATAQPAPSGPRKTPSPKTATTAPLTAHMRAVPRVSGNAAAHDDVRLTSATEDGLQRSPVIRPEQRSSADVFSVRDGGELPANLAGLKPGQIVRGDAQHRPRVIVPAEGLAIPVDDLHFENVDFLWPARHAGARQPESAAIMRLLAGRCEFRGCSFLGDEAEARPCAVAWTHPARSAQSASALPSGRIAFHDCVLRCIDAAVDCHTMAALACEWNNTLVTSAGPLVRLDHVPTVDEPLTLILARVTLRRTGPLLACHYASLPSQPGSIQVRASLSALALDAHIPLLHFRGAQPPQAILERLRWSGQGSLLAGRAPVAAWQPDGERSEALDDTSFSIEGLVRSEVEFAGVDTADPRASRVVRWQVPLRSPDPPGADPDLLPRGAVSAAQAESP